MSTDMSAKKALSEATTAAAAAAAAAATATGSFQLPHATIRAHRSGMRGHSNHGWLNTYHSFSFADWHNPALMGFGSLRVLNEDTVQPQSGFPTHPHRDFEIFSYVLSGELTHRDSMVQHGQEAAADGDRFFRVRRGDVQFTTGGTGIAHSEFNEHAEDAVHFLQIWAKPWRRGLQPAYHNQHFATAAKQAGGGGGGGGGTFVPILSPLAAGVDASAAEEAAAVPALPGTIPIHADFAMGAALVAPSRSATWTVGLGAAGVVTKAARRKVYVHLPMTTTNRALGHPARKPGQGARIRIAGRDSAEAVLDEGDGAFVDALAAGDLLTVENIGTAEAEVIVLDTA